MDPLPNELSQNICYISDTKTLKTLRLVHPILNDLAARVLFKTVYVAILKYSLQNLNRIATHPTLRFYVQKVMFLNQVLTDHYCDYQNWLWTIDLRARSDPLWRIDNRIREMLRDAYHVFRDVPFSDDIVVNVDEGSGQMIRVSEKDLVDKYLKYSELCTEQTYLLLENEMDLEEVDLNAKRGVTPKPHHRSAFDYISHAVTSLINLHVVETFEERRQVDHAQRTAWDSEGAPLSFLSRLQQETLLKDPFRDSKSSNHIRTATVTSQPLMFLLKALTRLDKRPSSSPGIPKIDLIINTLPWSFWVEGLGSLLARDPKPFLSLLTCIRSLDLELCIGHARTFQEANAVTSQMTKFFQSLETIEHLTLKFYISEHQDYSILGIPRRAGVWHRDVSEIFRQITYERLSTLSIGGCSFNEDVLVAFMQRHSKQLKRLKTTRLNILGESSSWRSAIERIAPVMSLDVVDLRCLLDDDEFMTDNANVIRGLIEYDKAASWYLELNGSVEYPSLSILDSIPSHNEREGS